jgi:glycosyltransferase involved in cell wall biosynthesis
MSVPQAAKPAGLSVFFPAYNDSGTIASMVIRAVQAASELTPDYEVIVVNDGSADATPAILDELARTYSHVRVVHHAKNRGYGGALQTGFRAATKELIFYTDGDAQYDPRELALLVPRLTPGIDVVNGYKIGRSDPLGRIVIGRLYHWAMKLLFGFTLRDVDCDFRLIRRAALERITLTSDTGMICLELVKKLQDAGCAFAEVPVHHYHRAYGKSQFFNFPRIWRTGTDILAFWWQLRRARREEPAIGVAPERRRG